MEKLRRLFSVRRIRRTSMVSNPFSVVSSSLNNFPTRVKKHSSQYFSQNLVRPIPRKSPRFPQTQDHWYWESHLTSNNCHDSQSLSSFGCPSTTILAPCSDKHARQSPSPSTKRRHPLKRVRVKQFGSPWNDIIRLRQSQIRELGKKIIDHMHRLVNDHDNPRPTSASPIPHVYSVTQSLCRTRVFWDKTRFTSQTVFYITEVFTLEIK